MIRESDRDLAVDVLGLQALSPASELSADGHPELLCLVNTCRRTNCDAFSFCLLLTV